MHAAKIKELALKHVHPSIDPPVNYVVDKDKGKV
jgi:hypothetical protein